MEIDFICIFIYYLGPSVSNVEEICEDVLTGKYQKYNQNYGVAKLRHTFTKYRNNKDGTIHT